MYIKPIWHRNSRCNYNNTEFILAGDFPVYTGQPILVYVSMRHGADTLTQDFFRAPAAGWTPSHATSQAKMLPCVPESLCQRVSNMFPSVLESLCQCVYSPFPFLTMSLRCDSTSLGASLASRNVKHAASMPLPAAAAGSVFSNLTLSSFVSESKTALPSSRDGVLM